MYEDVVKDLEKNIERLQKDKDDALRFHQFKEAERTHHLIHACTRVKEEIQRDDFNESTLTALLLEACRHVEADKPRYVAQCSVFGEVLRVIRKYPNTTMMAIR